MSPKLAGLSGLFLGALCLAASGQEQLTHTKDSLDVVKQQVDAGKAVIVDVREQNEWNAGHLKGAIFLPQSRLNVETEVAGLLKQLPKDKIIYTHCAAGRRALACGQILKQHGFDVRPLKPGYRELVEAGFEKAEPAKP
jgi:phage shock protein E